MSSPFLWVSVGLIQWCCGFWGVEEQQHHHTLILADGWGNAAGETCQDAPILGFSCTSTSQPLQCPRSLPVAPKFFWSPTPLSGKEITLWTPENLPALTCQCRLTFIVFEFAQMATSFVLIENASHPRRDPWLSSHSPHPCPIPWGAGSLSSALAKRKLVLLLNLIPKGQWFFTRKCACEQIEWHEEAGKSKGRFQSPENFPWTSRPTSWQPASHTAQSSQCSPQTLVPQLSPHNLVLPIISRAQNP